MKHGICATLGMLGSLIAGAFGGWDGAFITLLIFMAVDYLSGLAVALVFKKDSPRSENLKKFGEFAEDWCSTLP